MEEWVQITKILQLPVIVALIVLTFKIYNYESFKNFKFICIAWILNFIHIVLYLFSDFYPVEGFELQQYMVASFFDLIGGFLILISCRETLIGTNWRYNPIVPFDTFNLYIGFIAAFISICPIYIFNLNSDPKLNQKLIFIIPYCYVLFITYDGLSKYFTVLAGSRFNIGINHYAILSLKLYALAQFIPMLYTNTALNHYETTLNIVGYTVGLITKILIAFMLGNIVVAFSKYFSNRAEDPFARLLNEGFHEMKQPSISIENTCKLILTKEEFHINNKVRPLIEQIRTYNALCSALQHSYDSIIPFHRSMNIQEDFEHQLMTKWPEETNRSINLNGVIEMAKFMVQKNHFHKGIKFTTDYSGESNIYSNIYKMYQLFRNILNNACESFPDLDVQETIKGYNPDILIKTKKIKYKNSDFVLVTVSDNGIGMKSTDEPKIYDRGFTTKMSSKNLEYERGNGLYISKQIINEYKGEINLSTKNNIDLEYLANVTTFKIYLPINFKIQTPK